jgi:hypothetical protein
MRIRSIRPEFWTSEDIVVLDWDTRLVFIGLWSYVDDNGVGRDIDKLVVADLFPLEEDSHETLMRVSEGLGVLAEHGLITRYEADGKRYLFINKWDTHQRVQHPNTTRYPRPTSDSGEPQETPPSSSGETHEDLAPGEGEKGRRGEGEKGRRGEGEKGSNNTPTGKPAVDDGFDGFWTRYPRKIAKPEARKKWKAALKKAPAETIMAGLAKYAFSQDPQFVPHPSTWLNQERWNDTTNVTQLRPAAQNFWDVKPQ